MIENTTGNITTEEEIEEEIDRKGFATCWWCGHELKWMYDNPKEDFGFSGEGIVTILLCSGCGAECQMTEAEEE